VKSSAVNHSSVNKSHVALATVWLECF